MTMLRVSITMLRIRFTNLRFSVTMLRFSNIDVNFSHSKNSRIHNTAILIYYFSLFSSFRINLII